MHRRTWLQLGVGSAVLLAVGGGCVAQVSPGLGPNGHLAAAGRKVFAHAARGLLDGALPADPPLQRAALHGLLDRVDGLVAGLPQHAKSELSQLLALLSTAAGRRAFAGLADPWEKATVADLQSALEDMRRSTLAMRQQAYHALHDITTGAYFSEPRTWAQLGYPGPPTL